jgi:1,4-dihydroxy-2-naphthoate polyprenyltransferase
LVPLRRDIWVQLLLYPGHTLPTAAAPVLVGVGLALHDRVFAFWPALVAFLGSWLIHVAGVFTDNYELLRRHPDVLEHPELTQAVRDGSLVLSDLRWAIVLCLGLAALAGAYLVRIGGVAVVVLGTVGAVASLAYAGGQLAYAKRGLADLLFFVMFGLVAVVGVYYIQVAAQGHPRALPPALFLVGWPTAALVTNVLIIDDIRDHEFDRAKQWRTPAVRFGVAWSRWEFTALMVFAYTAPFGISLIGGLRAWVLLPLVTLPWGYRITRALRTEPRREDLVPLTPRMARLALIYSALLAAGIALS